MAYSCKGGKSAVLRPTARYGTAEGPHKPSPAKVFSNTLICNVEEGIALLAVLPPFDTLSLDNLPPGSGGSFMGGGGSGGGAIYQGNVSGRVVAWKSDASDGKAGAGDEERVKGKLESFTKFRSFRLLTFLNINYTINCWLGIIFFLK